MIGHRAFVIPHKQGTKDDSRTLHTPGCTCGWQGNESQSRTGALDAFDNHIIEKRREGKQDGHRDG